jgi:hypothetical protein
VGFTLPTEVVLQRYDWNGDKVIAMSDVLVRAHIVIPRGLIDAVDEFVGERKRSAFFTEAVEEKLRRERFSKALAETSGFIDEAAHPEWSTPEKVSAWVRELRSLELKAGNSELDCQRAP